jgi:hypothetical protein
MRAAHMPQQYWHDIVGTSVYLLNHMPSRVLNFHTPLQTLERYVKLPSTCTPYTSKDIWLCCIYTCSEAPTIQVGSMCCSVCPWLWFNTSQI